MNRNIPKPTIHVFKEYNVGKYQGVKHYELLELRQGTNLISTKLNLSKDRGFAKSSPTYWIKTRNGNKWAKKTLTGLFRTKYPRVFFGYEGKKKNLLLFKFSKCTEKVTIYKFDNYYTSNLSLVENYLK